MKKASDGIKYLDTKSIAYNSSISKNLFGTSKKKATLLKNLEESLEFALIHFS
jgi:hypothetical protein